MRLAQVRVSGHTEVLRSLEALGEVFENYSSAFRGQLLRGPCCRSRIRCGGSGLGVLKSGPAKKNTLQLVDLKVCLFQPEP